METGAGDGSQLDGIAVDQLEHLHGEVDRVRGDVDAETETYQHLSIGMLAIRKAIESGTQSVDVENGV